MKVLVAKRPASPRQDGDVWSAMQNEIVVAPFVCQDNECVCVNLYQGIISHGYSSQAQVARVDTSQDGLVNACRSHLGFSQWAAVVDHPSELEALAADLIDNMAETASLYPVGTSLRVTFDREASRWHFTTS